MPFPARGQRDMAVDAAVSGYRDEAVERRAGREKHRVVVDAHVPSAEPSTTRRSLPKMSKFSETVSSFWNEASIVGSATLLVICAFPVTVTSSPGKSGRRCSR